jgi:hypothetical protein
MPADINGHHNISRHRVLIDLAHRVVDYTGSSYLRLAPLPEITTIISLISYPIARQQLALVAAAAVRPVHSSSCHSSANPYSAIRQFMSSENTNPQTTPQVSPKMSQLLS